MSARNLGPASQSSHLRACKRFAAWLRRTPETARFCRKIYVRFILILYLTLNKMNMQVEVLMIDFKGSHYPKDVILYAVFFYVRYAVSYRDLEEIMEERGVVVDHATLNRWVVKYSPLIACEAHHRKSATSNSWRMDETYIKVRGKWVYLYRAVDKHGKTLDFMLSERRDEAAATNFFRRTITNNGWPEKVVIDKSGANLAGLQNMNLLLLLHGWFWLIDVLQVKYLNNIIEQDHRFIKKLTRPMKGFKSFRSASATLDGIEVAHMIRKRQFGTNGQSAFQQFASLAA
jgi:putative transposase